MNENDAQPVSAPTSPAPDEIEKLKEAAAKAEENWDKFLRATADLENYRKRVTRERDDLARFTREQMAAALLPALDNLERALEHSEAETPLHEGLLQVQKQFQRALGEFGLEEIVVHPGDAFDPNFHEAVSHVASADHPEGVVIEQIQSGYKLADQLLRPARVAVSKGAPTDVPDSP